MEIEALRLGREDISDFESRLAGLIPVKSGDHLYTGTEEGVHEWTVTDICVLGVLDWPEFEDPDIKHIQAEDAGGKDAWFSLYDIGNEVFLTKDDAEEYRMEQYGIEEEEEEPEQEETGEER